MTAIMIIDMGTMGKITQKFYVKQDSTRRDKKGILFTTKTKHEMVITGQTTVTVIAFSITGKADDNGGFMKTVIIIPSTTTKSGMTTQPATLLLMKENWDLKGTLLGSSFSTNGTTWTPFTGCSAPSGEYVMSDSEMSTMGIFFITAI